MLSTRRRAGEMRAERVRGADDGVVRDQLEGTGGDSVVVRDVVAARLEVPPPGNFDHRDRPEDEVRSKATTTSTGASCGRRTASRRRRRRRRGSAPAPPCSGSGSTSAFVSRRGGSAPARARPAAARAALQAATRAEREARRGTRVPAPSNATRTIVSGSVTSVSRIRSRSRRPPRSGRRSPVRSRRCSAGSRCRPRSPSTMPSAAMRRRSPSVCA